MKTSEILLRAKELIGVSERKSSAGMLPCPFCGGIGVANLGKLGHCQLHGDPFQEVVISCRSARCVARPKVSAGDVYNGGEPKARAEAIAAWNTRAALETTHADIMSVFDKAIAAAKKEEERG